MKKILCVASLAVMVWGCSKKMTPSKTETPTTNSGSVSSNTQPMTADPNLGKGTTGTASSSTTTSTTGTGTTENPAFAGSRVAPTATSPEAAAAIAGQKIYNAKCGTCHGLKVTTDFTSDRWASILAVMAPKAGLNETEKNNVYAYVKENSKK